MRVGIPIADLSAGLFAALGILVALLEREKSGKGQQIATSLLQAQIFMLDFQAARFLVEGEVAQQAGNNHPTSIPTGVFKTRDGYINIAATGQKMWQRLCGALDAEPLLHKPEYQTGARARRTATRSPPKSRAISAAAPAPNGSSASTRPACRAGRSTRSTKCSPIRRCKHLGMAQSVTKKDKSKMRLVGQPVSLSRTPSRLAARPPELGEHTDAVLKEFGFGAQREIARRCTRPKRGD